MYRKSCRWSERRVGRIMQIKGCGTFQLSSFASIDDANVSCMPMLNQFLYVGHRLVESYIPCLS